MAKKNKVAEVEQEESGDVYLNYVQHIHFHENCGVEKVVIKQSGAANQPPVKPPGGNG